MTDNDNIIRHTCGEYNFYTVNANGRKYVIGGVCERYAKAYIAEAADADALILLTSKPEFVAGVAETIEVNPNVEVYATAAGLRNIKEILNCGVNEHLIKDGSVADGIEFAIIPNVHWVDTAAAVFENTLFSGELFSSDGSLERFYRNRLEVNREFVASAVGRVKDIGIERICPAVGDTICDAESAFAEFERLTRCDKSDINAVVVYCSESGFTKLLAEKAAECFGGICPTAIADVKSLSAAETAEMINRADILAVGTNTVNRNMPQEMWDAITRIDLVNKRGMPYFVFGSFGWAGDGIKLADKTLAAMGLKRCSKPVEVLFKPTGEDFESIAKAVGRVANVLETDET